MLVAILLLLVDGVQASAKEPVPKLTFCSYNLKNWLLMDRRFNASKDNPGPLKPKPEKERAAVIATLAEIKPDILGVCEIGAESDLDELQKLLANAGLNYPHKEYCHGGDPTRRLGLLSRYPIVARDHQMNLSYKLGDLTMQFNRGILDATIQVTPDFQLRCMGLHLKSQRQVPEGDQEEMRRNEAHLLREHVVSVLRTAPETKLLLYGDFNDDPKSPGITEIRGDRSDPETRLSDVLLRDDHGEVWTHFYDWEDSYSRLDYFFVSPALHSHVLFRESGIHTDKDFNNASDHRPIVLVLSLASTKKTK